MPKGLFAILILLPTLMMCVLSVWADEFRELEVQHLNERYKDFYIHEAEKKRRDAERQRAASEQREIRRQLELEREAARRKQVAIRKNQPGHLENIAQEEEYLKKVEARRAKQDEKRRAFVRERQKLLKIRREAKRIPDEKELGLE